MRALLGGTILSLAVACSSGSGGGGGAGPRPPGPGSARAPVAPAVPAAGPSERECDELIAHAIALRAAELAQTLPPDRLPTDAEQAALRAELRGKLLAECRGGTRPGYDCAIASKSLAELAGCQSVSPAR